jgi:hypothetical protein
MADLIGMEKNSGVNEFVLALLFDDSPLEIAVRR